MTIFKEKVYPPHKLRDTKEIDGVKFNLNLLKSLTWLCHVDKIDNDDLVLSAMRPKPTKTKTISPPNKLSSINQQFLKVSL